MFFSLVLDAEPKRVHKLPVWVRRHFSLGSQCWEAGALRTADEQETLGRGLCYLQPLRSLGHIISFLCKLSDLDPRGESQLGDVRPPAPEY